MAKYSVSIPYHASIIVEVEADSEKEAEEKALNNCSPSVCCHCSHDGIQLEDVNMEAEVDVAKIESDDE